MAKLADAPDLGSGGAILRGSSPLPGKPLEIKGLRNLNNNYIRGVAVLLPVCCPEKTHTATGKGCWIGAEAPAARTVLSLFRDWLIFALMVPRLGEYK